MDLRALMAMLQGRPKQPVTVRPDYGLTGAMISAQRSPYERTMAPGEQRSAEGLQDMLAEVIMAAGSGALPGVQGRGSAPVRASRPKSSAPPLDPVEYLYHGTNQERAQEIAASGKLRTFRPSYGTPDQSSWPDGATKPRAYFTGKQEITNNFLPEGKPAILRVKKTADFKTERYTNDIYSEKPVSAKDIEILMPDGTWSPLIRSSK